MRTTSLLLSLLLLLGACSGNAEGVEDGGPPTEAKLVEDPTLALTVEATRPRLSGTAHTQRLQGQGVLVGRGHLLVDAGLVLGASAIEARDASGRPLTVERLVALDLDRDLALFTISGADHVSPARGDVALPGRQEPVEAAVVEAMKARPAGPRVAEAFALGEEVPVVEGLTTEHQVCLRPGQAADFPLTARRGLVLRARISSANDRAATFLARASHRGDDGQWKPMAGEGEGAGAMVEATMLRGFLGFGDDGAYSLLVARPRTDEPSDACVNVWLAPVDWEQVLRGARREAQP